MDTPSDPPTVNSTRDTEVPRPPPLVIGDRSRNLEPPSATYFKDVPMSKELHEAVKRGATESVAAILQRASCVPTDGLSPVTDLATLANAPDEDGITPLMRACVGPNPKAVVAIVQLLLAHKADPCVLDNEGHTALHWAAASNDAEDVIHLLITKGLVPVDCRSDFGETPSHRAARQGRFRNLDKLLSLGANPALVNHARQSVIDVAGVEKHGANINHFSQRLIREVIFKHRPHLRTLVLYHDDCKGHSPKEGHQESPLRIDAILAALRSCDKFHDADLVFSSSFPCADDVAVKRAHSADYFELVMQLAAQVAQSDIPVPFTPAVQRGLGLVPSHKVKHDETCDTSFSKGGAVCHAVDAVVSGKSRNAFCAVRPPGHHAGVSGLLVDSESFTSCGFCIFNSVAVGALHALERHPKIKRVAIVDWDVHHGNGTEEIVRKWQIEHPSTTSLYFFSSHLYDVELRKRGAPPDVDFGSDTRDETPNGARMGSFDALDGGDGLDSNGSIGGRSSKRDDSSVQGIAEGGVRHSVRIRTKRHRWGEDDSSDERAEGGKGDVTGNGTPDSLPGGVGNGFQTAVDLPVTTTAPVSTEREARVRRPRQRRRPKSDGQSNVGEVSDTPASGMDIPGMESSTRDSRLASSPEHDKPSPVVIVRNTQDLTRMSLMSPPRQQPTLHPTFTTTATTTTTTDGSGHTNGASSVTVGGSQNGADDGLVSPRRLKSALLSSRPHGSDRPRVFFREEAPVRVDPVVEPCEPKATQSTTTVTTTSTSDMDASTYHLPIVDFPSDAVSSPSLLGDRSGLHDSDDAPLSSAHGLQHVDAISIPKFRRSYSAPNTVPSLLEFASANGGSGTLTGTPTPLSLMLRGRNGFQPFFGTSGISLGPLSPSPAARVSLSIECGTMDDFFDDFNRDGRPVPLWMRKPDSARSDASRADMEVVYAFYPGTGKRDLLEYNIVNAPIVPKWRERRTVAKGKYAAVENVKHQSGRLAFRRVVNEKLLPSLRAYCPDLIIISAGFDGAHRDAGNIKNVGKSTEGMDLLPEDYEWLTTKVVEISRYCCPGKVVSVLEGGYGSWVREVPPDNPDAVKFSLNRSDLAENCARHVQALAGIAQPEDL